MTVEKRGTPNNWSRNFFFYEFFSSACSHAMTGLVLGTVLLCLSRVYSFMASMLVDSLAAERSFRYQLPLRLLRLFPADLPVFPSKSAKQIKYYGLFYS
jgi:hypothetical protein